MRRVVPKRHVVGGCQAKACKQICKTNMPQLLIQVYICPCDHLSLSQRPVEKTEEAKWSFAAGHDQTAELTIDKICDDNESVHEDKAQSTFG